MRRRPESLPDRPLFNELQAFFCSRKRIPFQKLFTEHNDIPLYLRFFTGRTLPPLAAPFVLFGLAVHFVFQASDLLFGRTFSAIHRRRFYFSLRRLLGVLPTFDSSADSIHGPPQREGK